MKILRNLPAIMVIMLVLALSPVMAQEDDGAAGLWWWAYDPLTMNVFAFDATGQVNPLSSGEISLIEDAWRVSPSTAFFISEANDQRYIQRVTADEIQAIPLEIEGDVSVLTANAHASIVINTEVVDRSSPASSPMLIINNETFETLLVESTAHRTAYLAADGDEVYYARFEADEAGDITATLVKTDIDTFETETIYVFPEPNTTVYSEQGQQYLYSRVISGTNEVIITAVGIGGEMQELDRSPISIENATIVRAVPQKPDAFIRYDLMCEEVCAVDYTHLETGNTFTFQYSPIQESLNIMPLRLYDADTSAPRLLAGSLGNLIMFNSDGSETWLGGYSIQYGLWLEQLLSPDGRYLFALNIEEQTYTVWDLYEMQPVMESGAVENFAIFGIHYSALNPQSFIVSENFLTYHLYHAGEITHLPDAERLHYAEVLSNGDVLAYQANPNAELARGTYLYQVESDTFTLLLEDAAPLTLKSVF